MNVWYVNSILGTFRLEEENDAICGLTLCPDGVPELEPLPARCARHRFYRKPRSS